MTKSFSKSNLMTGIAFAALFGVVIVTLRLATGGYGGPSSIPECNSNTTRDMLQDAFKDSPQATLGLKLLKIGDIGVVGKDLLDENDKVRHRVCVADVFTNRGRGPVYFNMSWADAQKSQIYLEAPMLPF